jgi:hypothetical protein
MVLVALATEFELNCAKSFVHSETYTLYTEPDTRLLFSK